MSSHGNDSADVARLGRLPFSLVPSLLSCLLGSNHKLLVSEAPALPTVPQPFSSDSLIDKCRIKMQGYINIDDITRMNCL